MQGSLIDDIHSLLDDEKAALLSARYQALGPLEEAKAELLQQLSLAGPQSGALSGIKAKLEENQGLLSASIAGVAAARKRVEALHNVRQGLSVYDRSGKLAMVPARHGCVEKKA